MNKRQTKKKNKKIEERLEEFCETVEELKKLGVYSFSKTSFDEGLQLQINLENFLNLPFLKKEQITVSSRDQLLKRFNGLKQSTLADYQREMESMDDFKRGVLKPTHSVTYIHIATFVDYLRWKEANRYRSKKIPLKEVKSC